MFHISQVILHPCQLGFGFKEKNNPHAFQQVNYLRVVLYLFHSVGTQADGSLSDTAEAAAGCHCDDTDPRTHKRCLVTVSPSVHSVGLTNISASFSSLPGWGNLLGVSVREFIDMRQQPPQAPSSFYGSATLWSHNTRQALVRTDNCTTTVYINRQSSNCHTVEAGIEPGYWPLEHLLFLRSLHMPGLENRSAELIQGWFPNRRVEIPPLCG